MNWQGWTALGVLGAAIAVPLIRKKMSHRNDSGYNSNFSPGADSAGTMGGRTAPVSETWAQGSGTP